jgi:hypothetical protein
MALAVTFGVFSGTVLCRISQSVSTGTACNYARGISREKPGDTCLICAFYMELGVAIECRLGL